MKYHERTRITIEFESPSDGFDIEIKCWDKHKSVKISQDEAMFFISSICGKIAEKLKGGADGKRV